LLGPRIWGGPLGVNGLLQKLYNGRGTQLGIRAGRRILASTKIGLGRAVTRPKSLKLPNFSNRRGQALWM
jgi:hypothetical protein